ncbi:RNA polymerase sigma factor RpoE [Enhygromyxa salina]|uniref:RNA polymerase sigma factor RpoE n=2 Tax=Enhygromyxa salina TaxID=215803 RepID=A0A2S9XDZ9_9BACT|nr:RNA polymerase sigma factor RpoE [Enhygromyxa salina]
MSLDALLLAYQACRSRAGRARAKTILLREIRVVLVSFFRSRVGAVDAEDLAQASLEIIARGLDTFEPEHPRAFRSHVFTVARNRLRTHARKEGQRARNHAAPAQWTADPTLPSEPVLWSERVDLLRVALAAVATTLRRAFMSRWKGEHPREFARREGIKIGTVRVRVWRALTAVEAELDKLKSPPREQT